MADKTITEKVSDGQSNRVMGFIDILKGRKALKRENGQSLVILAISFLALLAFIGLVTDAGSLYVTYTQLKRAVDAASVAAANNMKISTPGEAYEVRKQKVTGAAREMLSLHNITNLASLEVYLCEDAGKPSDFADMCPSSGETPRKLVYVRAEQNAPVYFLHLFGIQSVPFGTSSVGEAASVDLVLVLDTSESMASDIDCGSDNSCTPGYDPNNFNPAACNAANDCYPLRQAKDAAKILISRLLPGNDRVAIVHYDFSAYHVFGLDGDIANAMSAVDTIQVHDDAPAALLEWSKISPNGGYRTFNPIFPDDRDGDGEDADPGAECTDEIDYRTGAPGKDLWDDDTGEPCDADDILDAYDWNGDGDYSNDNDLAPAEPDKVSQLSTCIGCGVRLATEVLQAGGRPDSVWVMVFLSDGIANLSDTHVSNPDIPAAFHYGFCGSDPATSFWASYCIDPVPNMDLRYCIDDNPNECPPISIHTDESGPYSVLDYAFDMVDRAAYNPDLGKATPDPTYYNPSEPRGEKILIYAVALGAAATQPHVLAYMATLGDDNVRYTPNDPCDIDYIIDNPTQSRSNCNYYYAPTGAYLDQIFESIASRIFTKISR